MKKLLLVVAAVSVTLGQPSLARDDAAITAESGDPIIAEVNGHPIRLSDVMREVESQPLGDQIALRERLGDFAESLVREELLFQYAIGAAAEADPAFRRELKSAVVEQLLDRQVKAKVEVSDDEVRAFYDRHPGTVRGEELRASQIVLSERAECDALEASITTDEEFARIARERSLHSSAPDGGDLGMFMQHDTGTLFERALFTLQPGEMVVLESHSGCHLLRVTLRNSPPMPPLEEVAPRIRNLLRFRKEREHLTDLMERAEKAVPVERPASR